MASQLAQRGAIVQVAVEGAALDAAFHDGYAQTGILDREPGGIGWQFGIQDARRTANTLRGVVEPTLFTADDDFRSTSADARDTEAGVLFQGPAQGGPVDVTH